ncbi:T9SS type A sorting domain-containing protein [Lacinutrix jangbogonensis]|uniref:T9SS type A sorting domain-containing protein n=1 Tax=Lacinutrix jangbogonensis TaxID=1469557 RepID=UPI00053E95AF|nr:T9SS type A sorting domain-containing protein [Lacinutrix jangbogonensis]
MKKIYFLLLTLLISAVSFGQGTESFDGFTETGSSYTDGTFTGDNASWTFVQSRGDQSITGKSIMLGRNRTPQAELYSGTISGGIGTISFNYQRAFGTDVNLNILVNDIVVGTVVSTDNTIQNSGTITVNQPGDVVIKLTSVNNSDGQVTIDDITWTGFTGTATPSLSVSTPSNNQVYASGTTNVDVTFATANTNAGDQVNITVNGGTTSLDVSSPFSVPTLDGESYSALVELVDASSTVLDSETIMFSVEFPCGLQIGTITSTCDAETLGVDAYTTTIDFTGGGTSTYVINTTGGTGNVDVSGGNNPSVDATGTITITGYGDDTGYTVDIIGDVLNSSCNFSININNPTCVPAATCPGVGAVIVTEIMKNPSAVGDGDGEYFEVYNTTATPIDMIGWIISDDGSNSHTIGASLVVPAMGYAVLGINADMMANGGIPVDYEYSSYALSNGADEINLVCGATTIDAVAYTDGAFPDTAGAAMELSTMNLNATDNDNGANWANAITDLGTGDFGTPGTINANTLSVDTFENTSFSIYPNPASNGFVNITTTSNEAINVTVFDILGKQVISQTINNNRLDVSNLNTGVYILKLNQNGAITTKKLVIK